MTVLELINKLNNMIDENIEVRNVEVLIDQEDYGFGPIGFIDTYKWNEDKTVVRISGMG